MQTRSNIRLPATSLVGRQSDIDRVLELLETRRLVTIFGTAGLGKTRLSKHVAAAWVEPSSDRVTHFVDWCHARDESSLLHLTLDACGVDDELALSQCLDDRPTLLVLDNLEHVIDPAWQLIRRWLAIGELTILATSRERIGTPEEHVYRLEPLATPPRDTDEPERYDAVELFRQRARAANGSPDADTDLTSIAKIVRRLDGLPLAIELAALGTTMLTPSQIAERLEQRCGLPSSRARASDRQATLRGALEWSFDLLDADEQQVFAECSIFEAPFSVDDAARVVSLTTTDGERRVIEVLHRLVDKSMLRVEDDGLGYFQFVREFATARLEESGDREALRRRHAEWVEASAASVEDALAVLRASLEDEALIDVALQIVARFEPQLISESVSDGRMQLVASVVDAGLERCDDLNEEVAEALRARGNLRRVRGELDAAIADLELAASALPASGVALGDLGIAKHESGDRAGAEECYTVALERLQESGEMTGAARMVGSLAILRHEQGLIEEARTSYEQALATFRRAGDERSEAAFSCNLGDLYRETNRREEARKCYEFAADLGRRIDERRIEGVAVGNLGGLSADEGDYDEAVARRCRAADTLRSAGDRRLAAVFDGYAASARHLRGEFAEARAGYRDAIDRLDGLGDQRYATIFRMYEAVAAADLGEDVAETLSELLGRLEDLGEPGPMTALALHAQRLGVPLDVDASVETTQDEEVRFARALLGDFPAPAGRPDRAPVKVDPTGDTFIGSDGARVDLRRRRAPRLILAALARQAAAEPPERRELGVDELFEIGWPGESIHPEHGANRVYVAIATLRDLGLRDVLVLRDGYLLDPTRTEIAELSP